MAFSTFLLIFISTVYAETHFEAIQLCPPTPFCGADSVLDCVEMDECSVCTCVARCDSPICLTTCPNGRQTDESGCPTCQCKPQTCPPTPLCSVDSTLHCNQVGSCSNCRCISNKPFVCPRLKCPNSCKYGRKVISNCEVCDCKLKPTCPELPCPFKQCTYGHVLVNGCETCRCKQKPLDCLMIKCNRKCTNGFKVINGCHSCLCKPTTCPNNVCKNVCPHGYVSINGCPSCECKPTPPCQFRTCSNVCPNGYLKVDGCPSCQCKDFKCPVFQCRRKCMLGFSRDLNGCRICQCLSEYLFYDN